MNKLSKLAVIGIAAASVVVSLAEPPSWWASRGVTNDSAASDYAAATIGQVKNLATQAAAEMNASLSGGAGTDINNLIATWQAVPGPGVTRNDYATINLGQLKTIAKLFYDRLSAAGYIGPPLSVGQTYPWSGTASDYAVANIGQVKFVFSFDFSLTDSDDDGIPDAWEIYYGLNPNYAADASALAADGSGKTNLYEYQHHKNPKDQADDQSFTPGATDLVLRAPTGQFYDVNTSTWSIMTVGSP